MGQFYYVAKILMIQLKKQRVKLSLQMDLRIWQIELIIWLKMDVLRRVRLKTGHYLVEQPLLALVNQEHLVMEIMWY